MRHVDEDTGLSKRCINCLWFDTSVTKRDEQMSGMCRRGRPRIHKMTGEGCWPLVEDYDWCGAWEANPEQIIDPEDLPND